MPSVVLMGIGLSPQLAGARELPDPFEAGPCVSAPDREAEGAGEAAKGEAANDEQGAGPERESQPDADPEPGAGKSPEPGPVPDQVSEPEPEQDAGHRPEPGPSEPESRHPLDPTEEKAEEESEESASPSPSPSGGTKAGAEVGGEEAGETPDDPAEGAEDTVGEAKEAGEAGESEEPEAAGGGEEPEAAGEPYSCPEYDEASRNAGDERTDSLVPDTPWRLESTRLTLLGLDYHGIVRVRTYGGTVKEVLKFTADSMDIKDLHQRIDGPAGSTQHVEARAGSTSTIRGGTVTMYTEKLEGRIFGLVPVAFTPESPPPLDVSAVFFTGVSVVQAGQFGGTLTVPGMHMYNR
jgi:hypothetical protein